MLQNTQLILVIALFVSSGAIPMQSDIADVQTSTQVGCADIGPRLGYVFSFDHLVVIGLVVCHACVVLEDTANRPLADLSYVFVQDELLIHPRCPG